MAGKTKTARLRYEPATDTTPESYALEMETKEGWGLICRCPFHRSADAPDLTDAEFIHFSLIKEIFHLITLGYHVYFK